MQRLSVVSGYEIVPVTLEQARRFVAEHHRHNDPPVSHRFSLGLALDGNLVGVAVVGRPRARTIDDGRTAEIYRVTTLGDRNACSRLYGASCRAAAAVGYLRVITYTLQDEEGASLRAAGFTIDLVGTGDNDWSHNRHRSADRLTLFEPAKMPTGPKVRWSRVLGRTPQIKGRQSPTDPLV